MSPFDFLPDQPTPTSKKGAPKIIKILKVVSLLVVLLLLFLVAYGLLVINPRYQGKGAADHETVKVQYRHFLEEVAPEVQFEKHTCGLHTLRSIYQAYGLNPDAENLRVRLGVDVQANPADPTSTGTVQPDVLQVWIRTAFTTLSSPWMTLPWPHDVFATTCRAATWPPC